MYGEQLYQNALDVVDKKKNFYGLQKTDNRLNGLEKHQKLIESYIKLHQHRQRS